MAWFGDGIFFIYSHKINTQPIILPLIHTYALEPWWTYYSLHYQHMIGPMRSGVIYYRRYRPYTYA